MRSLWLAKKPKRKRALRANVVRGNGVAPRVEFELSEPASDREVAGATVSQARATCLCCGAVLPPERVRSQLAGQKGGADTVFDERGARTGGARMTAVVTLTPGEQGRHYRPPTDADYAAVRLAQERVASILDEWERGGRQGLCPVPDEPISLNEIRRISVPIYGMTTWGDLFTARQKATILILSKSAAGIQELTALSLGKLIRHCNVLAKWHSGSETVAGAFGRQTLPMSWDFPEMFPLVPFAGGLEDAFTYGVDAVLGMTRTPTLGQVQIADATDNPLPSQFASVWFTDPPYYDAIPYAHLSDFFFVWLRRSLEHVLSISSLSEREDMTPKEREIVVDRPHRMSTSEKDAVFYETEMANAFIEGRRVLKEDGVGCVVFAHKTTEGWEALLSGMIRGGWTITRSWPIATERGARLNARDTASLETSVHLICRPRPIDAPVGDWAVVLHELPVRVGDWMQRLEGEGVRGAYLVFACVGPALEVYSRYRAVETAEGREVGLPEYLERVWEVVGREALQQVLGTAEAQVRNGAAAALEEDARLTALFLWTLQSTSYSDLGETDDEEGEDDDEAPRRKVSGYNLLFDVVRRFAQPLGIHLDDWQSRIIKTEKGVVRLLPVTERAKQLFGESGADALADQIESNAESSYQLALFPEEPPAVRGRARRRGGTAAAISGELDARHGATTLDRVHAAMLLQASGRSQALRNLLRAEQERSPDFLRLANALTALYPRGSEEKRLLPCCWQRPGSQDAMNYGRREL